jgi:VanZ family protein
MKIVPDKQKFRQILLRLPAPLIAALIWFLSSQPVLPRPGGILGYDKLQHFLIYAALAFTAGLWVSPAFRKRRPLIALLLAALAGSVYGVIDEIHQYFVPNRDCSIRDWAADTLGAVLGAAGMMLGKRRGHAPR